MPDTPEFSVEMTELLNGFDAYFPPAAEHWADAYRDALIVLDANVLLHLYKFFPAQREQCFVAFEEVRDRIFIPHQVAKEFHRNRITSVKGHHEELKKLREESIKEATAFENRINQLRKWGINADELQSARQKINEALSLPQSVLEKQDVDWRIMARGDDPIFERLESLLTGRVAGPSSAEVLEIDGKEGVHRFKEEIPPGFGDARSKKENGDYLWWAEVLRACKSAESDAFVITNESSKGDWTYAVGDELIGPHPLLAQEFERETGHRLYIASLQTFLKHVKDYFDLDVPISEETIAAAAAPSEWRVYGTPRRFAEVVTVKNAARFLGVSPQYYAEIGSNYGLYVDAEYTSFDDMLKAIVADRLEGSGFSEFTISKFADLPPDCEDVFLIFNPGKELLSHRGDDAEVMRLMERTGFHHVIRVRKLITELESWWIKHATRLTG